MMLIGPNCDLQFSLAVIGTDFCGGPQKSPFSAGNKSAFAVGFFGAVHGLKNVLTKFISCVSEEASNFAGSERLSQTVQRVASGR